MNERFALTNSHCNWYVRCVEQKYFLTLLATRDPGCSVPRTERSTESIASTIEPFVRHLASGFGHRRRLACWDRSATPHCENRWCAVRIITMAADALLIAKLLFPPPVAGATLGVPKHNHDLKDLPYAHRKLPHTIL